ncbi:MAG: hypothetical protein ACI8X5_000124 [Planctomycetota bacterium]
MLLSVLVLFVLIAIVSQIRISTMTDARVGQNDVGLSVMERTIESAKWDVYEMLKVDGEEAAGGGGGGGNTPPLDGAAGGEEEAESPSDSSKDEWAQIQRTTINRVDLRIMVEAENAKYNLLNILVEDEEQAEEAYQRVVRILDLFREGTDYDISDREAEEMVRQVKEYLLERNRTNWPQPELLTKVEERIGMFMPMSMGDFQVLESWRSELFMCFRDGNDTKVHSVEQFLTVWSSPSKKSELGAAASQSDGGSDGGGGGNDDDDDDASAGVGDGGGGGGTNGGDDGGDGGDGGGGGGGGGTEDDSDGGTSDSEQQSSGSPGYGINLNLAPKAVLAGLFDDRDVQIRFWDDVVDYRNLDEEDGEDEEDVEPYYDQYNEEIRDLRVFESLEELSEVRSWDDYDSETQSRIMSMLTAESEVFTIYITARKEVSATGGLSEFGDARERERAEEDPGGALVRTVRSVVWRSAGDSEVEIIPIIPWEVLTYRPFQVQDYPEDDY